MFLSMIAYLVYFNIWRKEEFLNSSHNSRQQSYAEKVVRGSILSSDGETLARTDTDGEGAETRVYPYGAVFAQTVGYTQKGMSGLESSFSYLLLESHDDVLNQLRQEFRDQKKAGDDLVTTLNARLQQTAYDALGDYKGAVIALEPKTGRVLASVSKPSFDPNAVAENWEALNADQESGVFLNRGLQGQYPPGSTFKIVTALAYLRQMGTLDGFSFDCSGALEDSGYTIHCAGGAAHGGEDFAAAFANSCNTAFSQIGLLLDKQRFNSVGESLFLNERLELELPTVRSRFVVDDSTTGGLLMQTAIGQGDTLVTPMEMALITAAVANGGEVMKPRFVDRIVSKNGVVVKEMENESLGSVMTAEEAGTLRELMKGVVTNGTASSLSDLGYPVAGKTGSAEHGDMSGATHAWFVGFANADDPGLVVAVIAEEAGSGGSVAVPIARQMFEAYAALQAPAQ